MGELRLLHLLTNGLSLVAKNRRCRDESILCEVSRKPGNKEPWSHDHEERQTGNSKSMSRVGDQDVPDREKLGLRICVAEHRKG